MDGISRVAIVGAGTQGSMLACRALVYGKQVSLYSRRESSRNAAADAIQKWVAERHKKQPAETDAPVLFDSILSRLTLAETLRDAVSQADLIIETIPEILEDKRRIWHEIDEIALPHALLTSNSSSFRSSDIGRDVQRKEKTFNLNFMTPTKDDLVEVMWNSATSDQTKSLALAYLKELNHVPIITQKEIKGFSLNRVWRAIKKESLKLWAEGYITPEELDRAWMLEWGTPCGPFGLMDRVGLDIVQQIELSYYEESKQEDDLPPPALSDLIAKGNLGEKSGRGFYSYPNPAYQDPAWLRGE